MMNKWTMTKAFLSIYVAALLFTACSEKDESHRITETFTLQAIASEKGWGYIISKNNQPFIKQPIIPAIAGQHAFASKKDAELVGNIVLFKLAAHQSPSLTLHEIDSLSIYPSTTSTQ